MTGKPKIFRRPTDSAVNISRSSCIRCGVCCKKGGPTLHAEDKKQIEEGKIPVKFLFTIRKHEPAFDNIRDLIAPASTDIIKIKSQKDSSACIFYDPSNAECRIYTYRPIECRKLKCWDTREISLLYDKNRINRKTLLSGIEDLSDLIQDHQNRCSYKKIADLADQIKCNRIEKKEALEQLNEMLRYDCSIRHLIVEKSSKASEMLDFLFGRPLTATMQMFGLKTKEDQNDG
ncbi:MAG: YkgJ family cysteine cluster protein [Desulfobacterales bacterium]